MSRMVGVLVVLSAFIVGWHFLLWSNIPKSSQFSINPITDVVTIALPGASDLGFTDPQARAAFDNARDLVGGSIGEHKLVNTARESFDVYAMLLPYRVKIVDQQTEALSQLHSTPPREHVEPGSLVDEVSYSNPRFGFSIRYPTSFTRGASPENGDGLSLTSADGLARITVSGGNSTGVSTKETYNERLDQLQVAPTYKRLGGTWFVLSWQQEGLAHYEKVFVGTGSNNTLLFECPVSQERHYETVITRLEKSLKPGDLNESH